MIGEVTLKLEGATFEQTEHMREIIMILFRNGVFNMRHGKIVLHYDMGGTLSAIDREQHLWQKNSKSKDHIAKLCESVTISIK